MPGPRCAIFGCKWESFDRSGEENCGYSAEGAHGMKVVNVASIAAMSETSPDPAAAEHGLDITCFKKPRLLYAVDKAAFGISLERMAFALTPSVPREWRGVGFP